jgi:hypothetical protein
VDLSLGRVDLFLWTDGSVLLDSWVYVAGIYIEKAALWPLFRKICQDNVFAEIYDEAELFKIGN